MTRHRLAMFAIVGVAFGLWATGFATGAPQDVGAGEQASKGLAWVTPKIEGPRVSFHTFDSVAAKTEISYHLYPPAG